MKAVITHNYGKERIEKLSNLGYEMLVFNREDEIRFNSQLSDVEIMICNNPFSIIDIMKLKNLKWIQLTSMGIDRLPVNLIRQNNIMLTNAKGGYSIPIAEWIVLKILELYKNSHKFFEQKKNHLWEKDRDLLEVFNKNIVFIGTGSIAMETAKRLKGFEANLLGVNTKGKENIFFRKCYSVMEIDEVLKIGDIIILSLPLTEKTYHLINKDKLILMKDKAVLINVSRGEIIDENALIEHMEAGHLMGIALDVFEQEPLPKDNPLWTLENVLITPHNSYVSENGHSRVFQIIYENMKRYKENKELMNKVDMESGY